MWSYLLLHPLSCSSLRHDHFRASVKHHPRCVWKRKRNTHTHGFVGVSDHTCKPLQNIICKTNQSPHILRDFLGRAARASAGFIYESQSLNKGRAGLAKATSPHLQSTAQACLFRRANQRDVTKSVSVGIVSIEEAAVEVLKRPLQRWRLNKSFTSVRTV